jgi:hydrogenase expression/formation protein HypE
MSDFTPGQLVCPIPINEYPKVLLAHGGGGTLMHQLIRKIFAPTFASDNQQAEHDAARLTVGGTTLAFTTDSFVVSPLEFPGGDIGSLAVHGTVNDLAMTGAKPLYLSAGFILEEGLEMERLWKLVQSMQSAAEEAGVQIVTGDTKVVDHGKGDGLYVNTTGVGIIEHDSLIAPESIRPGDVVLVNGDLGRHGMAIMAAREGIGFESSIESDSASLSHLVQALLSEGVEIHCLRDLTRGGLVSATNELASATGLSIEIDEAALPVRDDVAAMCELLGFDPLYVANEGRMAVVLPKKHAEKALKVLRALPHGEGSIQVGVVREGSGTVTLASRYGAKRILTMISGEQLPRIC